MSLDLDQLIFDKKDIACVTRPNVRLIRLIFFKMGITHRIFLERYKKSVKEMNPHYTRDQFIHKCAVDRKFILDPKIITPRFLNIVLGTLGYIVQESAFDRHSSKVILLDTHSNQTHLFFSQDS